LVSHLRTDSFKVVSDMIPVDLVCNSIIVSAFSCKDRDALTILNYGTSHKKPLLWMEYYDLCREYFQMYPMKGQVFTPSISFESSPFVLNTKVFFLKELPAYMMQALSKV